MGGAVVLVLSWLFHIFFGFGGKTLRRLCLFASWYGAYLAHQSATSLERVPFLPVLGEHAVSCVGDE